MSCTLQDETSSDEPPSLRHVHHGSLHKYDVSPPVINCNKMYIGSGVIVMLCSDDDDDDD